MCNIRDLDTFLGYGDIAVPGLFISHCLKFDLLSGKSIVYFVLSILGIVRQFSAQNQTMGSVIIVNFNKTKCILNVLNYNLKLLKLNLLNYIIIDMNFSEHQDSH